jgi:endonuclease/exonuclease/phosphatase family metal-dependent hydrolase
MSARRPPPWAIAAAGAALPWAWFALRELGGRVEAIAVALPLVVMAALVILVGVAAVRREVLVLPAAVSVAILGLVTIVGPRMPHTGPAPSSPIRLVSANVYVYNTTPGAAVDAMIAAGADVEVAVETSPAFRTFIEERDAGHPYSTVDGQLVVRSRYPVAAMTDPPGVPARRILRLTVEGPTGPFVLDAVHALNPLSESTFANQLVWVKRLRAAASRESLPVVMAGDFNMSDRQLGYRLLTTDLRDAITAAGWGHSTYPDGIWAPLLLRIDHVVMPQDWCAARSRIVDIPGSDHDGLEVDVGPCP